MRPYRLALLAVPFIALGLVAPPTTAAPAAPPVTEAYTRAYAAFAAEALTGLRPDAAGLITSAVDDATTTLDQGTRAVVRSRRGTGEQVEVGIAFAGRGVGRGAPNGHGFRYAFPAGAGHLEAHLLRAGGVRYLAALPTARAPRTFRFALTLPADADLVPTRDDGAIVLRKGAAHTDVPDGVFASPVATDANGRPVPVRQRFTRDSVELTVLPTAETVFPVLADPTYQAVSCTTVGRDGTAEMYGRDTGTCPYGVTFVWANGYWPMRTAVEGGTTRVVRPTGQCTKSPEDMLHYDFHVPCQMHDYCYDLYRVAYPWAYDGVAVTDCDVVFLEAMREHCFSRIFDIPLCLLTAGIYYAAVRAAPAPSRGERPTGTWPYLFDDLLGNHNFMDGLAGWHLRNDAGSTANWTLYQSAYDKYLEFNCANTAPNCSVYRDMTFTGGNWRGARFKGGENLEATGIFRCKGSTNTCPVVITLWAHQLNGSWIRASSRSYQLSNPNQNQFWHLSTLATLPLNRDYDALRFEVHNKSRTLNVDMRDASVLIRT